MVNVDVSPSVILGVGLIGAGVSLWQIRQARPWISKDYDVVISCISLLVGGILIFQVGSGTVYLCSSIHRAICLCQTCPPPCPPRRLTAPPLPRARPRRAGAWTRCCCSAS
jgi:hypothetical protein